LSLSEIPMGRLWNTLLSGADKVFARDRMLARPLRIHIEVNDFCNLKCPHCPRENPESIKNTGNVPIEAIERLAPFFKSANYVGLTGNGEPFMHPKIFDILRIVTASGSTPAVISNGTLWKRKGAIEILPTLGPMIITVSFDGGTKETFEKWRKPAIFEEVLGNLAALRDEKKRLNTPFPIVNFLVCLMKDNIGETEKLVEIAAEHGISVLTFQNMYPYVKEYESERIMDLPACEAAVERARVLGRQRGVRVEHLPMAFDVDDRSAPTGNGTNGNGHHPPVYHCNNVWEQIHVTVKGEVKFCCWWRDGAIGDLTKDDLKDLWNSAEWVALRRDLSQGRKPRSCEGCHNLVRYDRDALWGATKTEMKDLARR
jgi:MoaA/NifB/PqqE/SkfB family radical SAM enzyme